MNDIQRKQHEKIALPEYIARDFDKARSEKNTISNL